MEHDFDKGFLTQIKNVFKKKATFGCMPPGDDRQHNEEIYWGMATGPNLKYIQSYKQQICKVCAMAGRV